MVVVNSEWSRQALVEQGVPAEKVAVIPLAYEPPTTSQVSSPPATGVLNVLWLGSVNLRKGIQYLVEAARLLREEPVQFHVVGPIGITEEAVQSSPENMRFRGRVPRDQTAELYRDADAFVLPTLSDGFAITQLEAMAHGCPVIATPNCGRVVTPEEDGLLVPPRDPKALAEAVLRCAEEREMLSAMSRQAQQTAQRFTLDAYADRLLSAVEKQAIA
jgi:glycosyltransferase involved in cell wall biosynthesis